MTITPDVLASVARLARLSLSPEERRLYERQLDAILEAMAALQRVDTKDIPPASLPTVPLDATRNDAPETRHHAPAIVDLAPDHTGRYVRLKGGMFSS